MPGRLRCAKLARAAATIAVAVLIAASRLYGVDVKSLPKPTGYVNDLAGVIDAADKARLEALCTQVEQQLAVQFALVTVDTIGDRPIRDFALDLSRKWGVGDRKSNQGVLLLLAVKDRKSDIETGRGIEPYITDGFAGSTLRAMRPELRDGNYGAAMLTAARSMAAQIAAGKGIPFSEAPNNSEAARPRAAPEPRGFSIPAPLVLLGFIFLLWLLGRGGRGRRGGGGGGFWPGYVIGSMLGGGPRSGSDWGSGGGFGRGSGGSGGFGGFGGGDFGGGGASSDW